MLYLIAFLLTAILFVLCVKTWPELTWVTLTLASQVVLRLGSVHESPAAA
jgi:hypothetical protein